MNRETTVDFQRLILVKIDSGDGLVTVIIATGFWYFYFIKYQNCRRIVIESSAIDRIDRKGQKKQNRKSD